MKTISFYCIVLLFFSTSVFAQSGQKIYLNIENIPKIQHKIQTNKYSWREDKSPTILYQLENNATQYEIKYSTATKSLRKEFDHDHMYLRLRYNLGKYQWYVLRRGDSVFIEYDQGKPYIEVVNRALKKHDEDVQLLLQEFDVPATGHILISKNGKLLTKEEREQLNQTYIKEYGKQVQFLDSLYKNDLLSQKEYVYYRNTAMYSQMRLSKAYQKEVLREQDLHINKFVDLIAMHVRWQLKKPIISLGNGSAVNSLEAFDIAKKDSDLSITNRNHLLESFLKSIKIDFPVDTYQQRRKEFESLTSKKINELDEDTLITSFNTLHNFANTVELSDVSGTPTTLSTLLEQYKGKVVYIDFWASWCAPCRAAFSSYPELFKAYENKDIVFLFVSTDRDVDMWEKATTKEQLSNSYITTNYPKGELFQKLNMRSVPRYLIFGKNGKLANHKAPGPDSDNITQFIDAFLKQ
jgi:thiol-disulfide isomerase/thioredoxin